MTQVNQNGGPGASPVSRGWTIVLLLYKFAVTIVLLYVLTKLWPFPTPDLTRPERDVNPALTGEVVRDSLGASGAITDTLVSSGVGDTTLPVRIPPTATPATAMTRSDSTFLPIWLACRPGLEDVYRKLEPRDYSAIPKCVYMFGREYTIWDEQRLLLMVLLAGAIGSMVHALRSLSTYVGSRKLKWSWVPYYILLPITGASTALIFYVVIRGGFFSANADFNETSPFGFTAVAALVGLFSQSAILKLQKIAENIFERPEEGKDAIGDDGSPATKPEITGAQRRPTVTGGAEDIVDITGAGFAASSKVEVNGKPRLGVFESETLLSITLEAAELAVLDNGGDLRIVVINDKLRSNEWVVS